MNYTLMNTPMTKAILDGRKTQTRRVIKDYVEGGIFPSIVDRTGFVHIQGSIPKYEKGETIWVREPAKVTYQIGNRMKFLYKADNKKSEIEIPKRFIIGDFESMYQGLPRWIYENKGVPNGCIKEMARIFLKVTDVRVERLQDIDTKSIRAEGIKDRCCWKTDIEDWINLWNKTAPKGYQWKDNPYVFVYEFERVEIK